MNRFGSFPSPAATKPTTFSIESYRRRFSVQQSDASFEIRARYLVLIKRLSDYFSRSAIKDHTAILWLDALEGAAIEIPHLHQAVDLLAAKSKFMPSLADLIST